MDINEIREKIAKELYFEGEDFEDGTIAMETWVNGNPKRLEPYYKRADRILSTVIVPERECPYKTIRDWPDCYEDCDYTDTGECPRGKLPPVTVEQAIKSQIIIAKGEGDGRK